MICWPGTASGSPSMPASPRIGQSSDHATSSPPPDPGGDERVTDRWGRARDGERTVRRHVQLFNEVRHRGVVKSHTGSTDGGWSRGMTILAIVLVWLFSPRLARYP